MKAYTKCLAVLLAAGSLFTLAGCKKSTPDNRVATTANWNERTSAIVEKNYVDYWLTHAEIATYSISFEEGSNTQYTVSYDTTAENAVYETKFYMEGAYDWTAGAIPESYRAAEAFTEPVYVYETTLTVSGKYKITSSGDEKAFTDSIKSVCKYRLAGNNLQPVYSKQEVKNTAPNSLGTNNIEASYVETDCVYETFYNRDFTRALVYEKDNKAETQSDQPEEINVTNKQGYSLFDSAQLRAAARAFTMTGGATRTFNVLAPQNKAVQTCTATITEPVALNPEDEEQKKLSDTLTASAPYIFFDGTPDADSGDEQAKTIRYNAVAFGINANLRGATPTCWYTTVENADVNTTRSVLIRMTTPLSFGLGTLKYTLSKLEVKSV